MEWLSRLRSRLRYRRSDFAPLPADWVKHLEHNVAHYGMLDAEERTRLGVFIRRFLRKKSWEGCGGLQLDDEIRVTISALAGLLVLGRPHLYYRNVRSILVYPSTVVTPSGRTGPLGLPRDPASGGIPILGEAQLRGPVILVWDAVLHGARDPRDGRNVAYHEFAHKLDMLDGAADGTPPIGDREAMRRWVEVCGEKFQGLRKRAERGERTFLDAYAATNEAEFFAVATEFFFDKPQQMQRKEPELYDLLRDFYRQDPAARVIH